MKERRFQIGTVIVVSLLAFAIAFLFHDLYQWTGECKLIGGFVPVNESVWEHLKLAFYPVIIAMAYPLTGFQQQWTIQERILQAGIATFLAICVVFFGYYGIHTGFGIQGEKIDLVIDIGLLVLGELLGIYHGFRFEPKTKATKLVSVFWLVFMALIFWWFTAHPGTTEVFRVP